ncbi:transmembrane epididymal protein 1 [Antechinus flavipes]|uniref:transmembrane epididymal protein 1 n=1 Tax=Antechinus flavipes TaxID=38775 RepID=UPI002235DD92|nr:transmembrane epididymal protein 1 [Antechinus flavipes]
MDQIRYGRSQDGVQDIFSAELGVPEYTERKTCQTLAHPPRLYLPAKYKQQGVKVGVVCKNSQPPVLHRFRCSDSSERMATLEPNFSESPVIVMLGDFGGHMIAGLSIFIFGIYQALLTSLALLRDPFSPELPRSQKRWGWLLRLPLDGLLKVLLGLTCFLRELLSLHHIMILLRPDDPQFTLIFPITWQHLTMFIAFVLSGLVDLVSQVCLAKRRRGLELGAQVLATLVLASMMSCHILHKEGLKRQSHILLLFSISLLVLTMTIELWVPNQAQLWLIKSWLFLVTGSWLMHLAYIHFHPSTAHLWYYHVKESVMFLTIFFCWHMIVDALVLGVIYTFSTLGRQYCGPEPDPDGNNETEYYLCRPESPDEELQEVHIQSTPFLQSP